MASSVTNLGRGVRYIDAPNLSINVEEALLVIAFQLNLFHLYHGRANVFKLKRLMEVRP